MTWSSENWKPQDVWNPNCATVSAMPPGRTNPSAGRERPGSILGGRWRAILARIELADAHQALGGVREHIEWTNVAQNRVARPRRDREVGMQRHAIESGRCIRLRKGDGSISCGSRRGDPGDNGHVSIGRMLPHNDITRLRQASLRSRCGVCRDLKPAGAMAIQPPEVNGVATRGQWPNL